MLWEGNWRSSYLVPNSSSISSGNNQRDKGMGSLQCDSEGALFFFFFFFFFFCFSFLTAEEYFWGYVIISLQACREVGQFGVYESAVGVLMMVASHQALEPTEFFNKYLQSIQNADWRHVRLCYIFKRKLEERKRKERERERERERELPFPWSLIVCRGAGLVRLVV